MAGHGGWRLWLLLTLLAVVQWAGAKTLEQPASVSVPLIEVVGAIGPPAANYVERTLEAAAERQSPFVVLRIDTPGGLSASMRDIIKDILAAPMPVVCWVGPSGARAASAGTYILYACGVAAMAPGTNLGAATPVQLSGVSGSQTPAKPQTAEQQKVLNDAIAYIRSLAELRGRNVGWAEKAVREAASISAESALDKGVIDLLATDQADLLARLDGMSAPSSLGDQVIHSQQARLEVQQHSWKERFLALLSTPTLAYLLLMIGIYGLILEGLHPGAMVPGTVGAICLILALFALHTLPVNWAGFALIVLGAVFLVAEAFVPSFGVLGLSGVIAFVIGSIMLFDSDSPAYSLPFAYIAASGFVAALGLGVLVYFLAKMRRQPVVSGQEGMIGLEGRVLEDFEQQGYVLVAGERWQASSRQPLHKGDRVVTESLHGLVLSVRLLDAAD